MLILGFFNEEGHLLGSNDKRFSATCSSAPWRSLAWACSLFIAMPVWAGENVDLVRVLKGERKLQLMADGKVQHEFRIALGASPQGHKTREGDERTPEGRYVLDYKKADSGYRRSIHISYPNKKDVEHARKMGVSPGGQIMIHGQRNGLGWLAAVSQRFDWTNGCVALRDADMDLVWNAVKVGTPIELLP